MLLCAGLLGARGEQRREQKEPPVVPPPQPIPQQIKVQRGEDATIPLRIYGRRNQNLTFLIRKFPKSGQLGGLKNTEAEAAIIQYRPPADRSIIRDVFEYAVKSTEGVSAPVPVQIEIIDRPADFIGPGEVVFLPRLTGTSETQTIELTNRGGQTAEGECRVEAPWRLEEPEQYRVDPNARLFVKVTFAPDKPGEFLGELRLSSQPDRVVVLRGAAREPLAVRPSVLRLTAELATQVRAGILELTNNTEDDQTVQVTPSARLYADNQVRVPAGQTVSVMIRTKAEDASALDGEVTFKAGDLQRSARVVAGSLPAIIQPVDRVLDFGPVAVGPIHSRELVLRNVGGAMASVSVTASPPLRVNTPRFALAPGNQVSVPVQLEAFDIGTLDLAIDVRTDTGSFKIPVRATVTGPGSAPARTIARSAEAAHLAEEGPAATPMPMSPHDIGLEGKVDPRQVVKTSVEATRCTLSWYTELSPGPKFVAEQRNLAVKEGQLSITWERLPPLTVERSGEKILATLERLQPGHQYTIRILAARDDGTIKGLVAQTSFTTALPGHRRGAVSWLSLLCGAAVVLLGLSLWQRVRPAPRRRATVPKTQKLV